MNSRAREKFYDLYALLKGENLIDRSQTQPVQKKKKKGKKKDKKTNENYSNDISIDESSMPEALEKVMKDFYTKKKTESDENQNPVDTKNHNSDHFKIGKDVIELKHEREALEKSLAEPKKTKKAKKTKTLPQSSFENLVSTFTAMTGKSVEDISAPTPMKKKQKTIDSDLPMKRKVEFNLKMNTTKVFDKKKKIKDSSASQPVAQIKSILKKNLSKKSEKPKKKQKTASFK